jgi:ElaB/YqjD/DUF883 family membrane-anchored ribosome-binding protein
MGQGADWTERGAPVAGVQHDGVHVPRIVAEAKKADDALCAVVRKRPITALCAALAVGYVIGRVMARRG